MFKIFKKKNTVKIITDESRIKEVVERGVEKIFPNDNFLTKKLKEGKRLKIYMGIDPTGPTLHMGHMVILRKLQQLQKMGHEIVLLIGDFTARIGDPDKKDVRKQLTHKEILDNARLYKSQSSVFLDFNGSNPADLVYNNDWLGKLNFADVLDLSSKMSVQQMLERDMFKRRIKEERPIYIHEFMYPLMQGYDSVAMEVDGEVGGNDQTFNMMAGRHLLKEYKNKEKFVIPMKLLVDSSGDKMGKTTGNMLSFIDSADEKFGKVMSWTDGMILSGFELLTAIDLGEVQNRLDSDENPKNIKRDLALDIVEFYHSKEDAESSMENWETQFSRKEVPDNLKEFEFEVGIKILEVLNGSSLISSNKEGRRKIDERAVQIDGEKIDDYYFELNSGEFILKLGKKMIKVLVK